MVVSGRVWGGALIALSCVGLACSDGRGEAAASEPPRIEVKAAVAPFDVIPVTTAIDGRIAAVNITEGAAVRQGDILMTMTNPAVDRDLAYARAQIASSQARMRPRRTNNNSSANAEAERAAADVLHAKEAKLARYRGLLATGDVSKDDVADVEAEYAAARRDWLAARERATTVVEAGDPTLVQADIQRARADEAVALRRQSQLTIAAPANGTLAKLRAKSGDDAFPRDTVAEIVDTSTARVQAQVAPELLRFIHNGSQVDVRLLTVPPRTFREPVTNIDSSQSIITVTVPNPDRLLRPGTPAVIVVQ